MLVKAAIYGEVFGILNVSCPPGHHLMNPLIDRLPSSLSTFPRTKYISGLCKELGYVDVWRTLHPADKEFTFFLTPISVRIGFFFLPPKLC